MLFFVILTEQDGRGKDIFYAVENVSKLKKR